MPMVASVSYAVVLKYNVNNINSVKLMTKKYMILFLGGGIEYVQQPME